MATETAESTETTTTTKRKEWAPSVDNTLDMKKLGEKLAELRTSLNLDESALAKRSGVGAARIKKIEGGAEPTLKELAGLATGTDYTVSGLLRRLMKA